MRSLPTSELLRSPRMTSASVPRLPRSVCGRLRRPKSLPLDATAFEPSELYPLDTGNAWSYDVDTGEASTTLAITRVEAFDGRIAEVHTGRAVVRYEVLPEGIRVPPDDEWLLRAPLVEGATWPGRGGRTARLISTEDACRDTRRAASNDAWRSWRPAASSSSRCAPCTARASVPCRWRRRCART